MKESTNALFAHRTGKESERMQNVLDSASTLAAREDAMVRRDILQDMSEQALLYPFAYWN